MQLPVGAELLAEDAAGLLDLALGGAIDHVVERFGHRAEKFGEARAGRTHVAEHEAAIRLDARHLCQAEARILHIERRRHACAMRHVVECTVEPELPGVIRAYETGAVALTDVADACAAMGAAIDQRVDPAVAVARDDHLLAAQPGQHEIAGCAQLAFMREKNPAVPEDAFHLQREDFWIGVDAPMHAIFVHQRGDVSRVHRCGSQVFNRSYMAGQVPSV